MASSAMQFFSNSQGNKKNEKFKNAVCISVNRANSCFDFCSMDNGDKNTLSFNSKEFTGEIFSQDFLKELTAAVSAFMANRSSMENTSVTLVLPDGSVAMDTVSIPNINRRRNEEALDATISGLFKNKNDLFINPTLSVQNKQAVTYSLAVANKELLESLKDAMKEGGMEPTHITFAANAQVDAITHFCPKLKSNSYLFMDIKENITMFSFVANGKTVGYYDLPFGYSIMSKNKVASEDMLFEHSVAELAVLNAKEKARAKQLTMMENDMGDENDEDPDAMFGSEENSTIDPTDGTTPITIKTLPKKTPRKLPKFMQRPEPQGEEGYAFENFRLFMKWALTLIEGNLKLTTQGEPEAVYVNMPADFEYLYDMANEEKNENKIEFSPIGIGGESENTLKQLELVGGLFAPAYNKNNNF